MKNFKVSKGKLWRLNIRKKSFTVCLILVSAVIAACIILNSSNSSNFNFTEDELLYIDILISEKNAKMEYRVVNSNEMNYLFDTFSSIRTSKNTKNSEHFAVYQRDSNIKLVFCSENGFREIIVDGNQVYFILGSSGMNIMFLKGEKDGLADELRNTYS